MIEFDKNKHIDFKIKLKLNSISGYDKKILFLRKLIKEMRNILSRYNINQPYSKIRSLSLFKVNSLPIAERIIYLKGLHLQKSIIFAMEEIDKYKTRMKLRQIIWTGSRNQLNEFIRQLCDVKYYVVKKEHISDFFHLKGTEQKRGLIENDIEWVGVNINLIYLLDKLRKNRVIKFHNEWKIIENVFYKRNKKTGHKKYFDGCKDAYRKIDKVRKKVDLDKIIHCTLNYLTGSQEAKIKAKITAPNKSTPKL